MNRTRLYTLRRGALHALWLMMFFTVLARRGSAQGGGYERTFVQSRATVEKVLQEMQSSIAGRLPVLDGFALASDHPLDRYQRGYFQSTVQVSPTASGGSVVHVSTKVTAWYSDPIPSRSGYQLVVSNGRLEVDLLDELAAELARRPAVVPVPAGNNTNPQPAPKLPAAPLTALPSPASPSPSSTSAQPAAAAQPADSTPSAPTRPLPQTGGTFSSSLAQGLAAEGTGTAEAAPAPPPNADQRELKAEAESLEEILKNQTHPKNLVAVKKSGTPVVATASLTAKTLFLANSHDEFEMLDFNADWVHVKISGLSRGWIWRTGLEMPDGIPEVGTQAGVAPGPTADELFRVSREETAPFPGDWEPLRNKNVRIISVQKTDESAPSGDAKQKLEFAKSLLDKSYTELGKNASGLSGIVLIFDSADGGMIATTLATLQQWKAGTLSDSALWHQSYFDPPETFGSASPSGSQ